MTQDRTILNFKDMKPGHILRFATCPSTIHSPPGPNAATNDNTRATAWPEDRKNLGSVQCLSHPSGKIGAIAADVATRLRKTPGSIARTASYSPPGRFFTSSDRVVGELRNCHFVGFVDGQSNYIQSALTVFSKDFSGCLMVAYRVKGQRRVAHAAASHVPSMDCKQAFLTTLKNNNAVLIGWFKPLVGAADSGRKAEAFDVIKGYVGNNIDNLTTFGVVTEEGKPYSVDAFKPTGIDGNDWVVTDVSEKDMNHRWSVH
jgi:hypothetical protein